ncbi:hypothetical protein J6590_092856 [Homalodisca vitripennis]|nr:hypothetical protein J6590_092856 [Homalodisca vitripennis]
MLKREFAITTKYRTACCEMISYLPTLWLIVPNAFLLVTIVASVFCPTSYTQPVYFSKKSPSTEPCGNPPEK